MTTTLVLPEQIADELLAAVVDTVESAGVLLVKPAETPNGNLRLLAREMHWVPESAYRARSATALSIASEGYVRPLSAAEKDQAVPLWLHTHPGRTSTPVPSKLDHVVDQEISDVFRLRSGSPLYGALVLSPAGERLAFTGHIESREHRSEIDRLWAVGRRFALTRSWLQGSTTPPDRFDRNIRAFGGEVQRTLAELRIAVVGCGGTGSAVLEQLVRLGVRHIQVFDPDELTESNVTRVYGSFPDTVAESKVSALAAHALRIAPDLEISPIPSKITLESAAKLLTEADIIFGCTDDNTGRLVLSRIATYFLTPIIDCGVLLTSGCGGELEGIYGRVTVLTPGAACLVCRNRVDLERASAEMLTPAEHQRRADEGYAPALPGIEPAVVAFTTQVAATAIGELLERLIHYGPEPVPTEVLLRAHDRHISTNDQLPRDGHYCHQDRGKLGLGVTQPFLEQAWAR